MTRKVFFHQSLLSQDLTECLSVHRPSISFFIHGSSGMGSHTHASLTDRFLYPGLIGGGGSYGLFTFAGLQKESKRKSQWK